MTDGEASHGTLLGGRVVYRQRRSGYRTGVEPVLLAASVPARPGERVVEAGCGAGAGLLCLAARVPGLSGLGLEIDPALAALAAENFLANGHGGLRAEVGDVTFWRPDGVFDHAFVNPPWHRADGTASPDAGRRGAKMAQSGLLAGWAAALGAGLRRRGTLSLILPAASAAQGVMALVGAACGEISLLPLWPREGAPARLLILRGVKHGGGADRVLAGLVLHTIAGDYSDAAEQVLRRGEALMG